MESRYAFWGGLLLVVDGADIVGWREGGGCLCWI
jgi:hypothetical protein